MCKVIKNYGVVAVSGSKELKLQTITNLKKEKRLALVSYKDGMSVNITDITIEAKELKRLLEEYLDYKTPQRSEIVKSLISLPVTDINYQTALKDATKEDLTEALKLLQNGSKNNGRIKACTAQLNKLNKLYTKPQGIVKDEEEKPEEKKAKVLTFPIEEQKPKIIPLVSEGTHTYEECVTKLTEESKLFHDADSQYVIEGLLEACKTDAEFRNNVMREDKTYGGFMEYMFKAAINGYCVRYGDVGWIDRDTGLKLAFDYYNADCEKMKEEEKKKREEEAAKRKAEAEKLKQEAKKNGKTNKEKKTATA